MTHTALHRPAPILELHRLRSRAAAMGLAVAAAGVGLCGVLADGAAERGDLSAHDPGVTAWFVAERSPWLTGVAQGLSAIGSEVAIGLLALVVLAVLALRSTLRNVLVFGGGMAVAVVLTLGVKHLLGRHRPPASLMLGAVDNGFSFPSGHTLFSTVFLGLVVGLLLPRLRTTSARIALGAAWVALSAAIGVSRVYLGYHWMTDVVAGWTLAIATLAACAVAWQALAGLERHTVRSTAGRVLGRG